MCYQLTDKESRKFYRRMRASNMSDFLKSGCDMGWYGHFKGPVPTPKLAETLRRFTEVFKNKPTCYHETGCEEDYPGKRAKKLGYVVGCIGCPQCGVTISGHISNKCGFCGYEFFRKE